MYNGINKLNYVEESMDLSKDTLFVNHGDTKCDWASKRGPSGHKLHLIIKQ